MSIAPEAVSSLVFPPESVDHVLLAEEAQRSRAKMVGPVGAESTRLALLLKEGKTEEFIGEAIFRSKPIGYSQKANTRHVSIEQINVCDPYRNHLGMLVAADAVINAYHYLNEVQINPFIEAARTTVPSIAPHLEGWHYEEDTSAITPLFALVRDLPSLRCGPQ